MAFNTSSSSINLTSNLATLQLHSKENSSFVTLEDELPSAFFSSDLDFEEPVILAAVSPAKKGLDALKTVKAPDYRINRRAPILREESIKKQPDLSLNSKNNARAVETKQVNAALPIVPIRKEVGSVALNTSIPASSHNHQQHQQQNQPKVPSTPPRKPMTAPLRSLEELRREKARLSDQICDLLDSEDEASMKLLKELKEKRKQIDAEINNYSHDSFAIGETQFTGPSFANATGLSFANTIPETPIRPPSYSSRILMQTPNVRANTSITASTPGHTQLSNTPNPAIERWSKEDFPWSRDVKKALNS